MFETLDLGSLKEASFKAFLTVFLAGIELHPFSVCLPRTVAVCPQATLLVDTLPMGQIKLHIGQAFPFDAVFVIVTRPIGIVRVE